MKLDIVNCFSLLEKQYKYSVHSRGATWSYHLLLESISLKLQKGRHTVQNTSIAFYFSHMRFLPSTYQFSCVETKAAHWNTSILVAHLRAPLHLLYNQDPNNNFALRPFTFTVQPRPKQLFCIASGMFRVMSYMHPFNKYQTICASRLHPEECPLCQNEHTL